MQRSLRSTGRLRFLSLGLLVVLHKTPAPSFERVFRLAGGETVFAYARISPDGRQLLYSRETRDSSANLRPQQTVRLIELSTGRAVFEAPGVDAYWAPEGDRFIYQEIEGEELHVNIWSQRTKAMLRDVAPPDLGDYFSWGKKGTRDLILTINSNYYFLGATRAEMPAHMVPRCPEIGIGERPLLSKDGLRVTTFAQGTIVVRDLVDCDAVIHTNLAGAKADFSWDGRYIAFHAPRPGNSGYDIQVVDLVERTVRTITANLSGSSFFPSWTVDGRVCFRYEGADYNGFVMAANVFATAARPLPSDAPKRGGLRWSSVFGRTVPEPSGVALVLVWSTWIAHSPVALTDFQRAQTLMARAGQHVGFFTATEPYSKTADIQSLFERYGIALPLVPLPSDGFQRTDAVNQIPTTLMFRAGQLVDRRLGAQTASQLVEWINANTDR